VESLASSILNKVLHAPIAALKKDADGRNQMELVALVREIFDLPDSPEQAGSGEEEDAGKTPPE